MKQQHYESYAESYMRVLCTACRVSNEGFDPSLESRKDLHYVEFPSAIPLTLAKLKLQERNLGACKLKQSETNQKLVFLVIVFLLHTGIQFVQPSVAHGNRGPQSAKCNCHQLPLCCLVVHASEHGTSSTFPLPSLLQQLWLCFQ